MPDNNSSETQVLISGAGPTGLTLACELACRGIAFRLVDKKSGPSLHSKALGVHSRTLEHLHSLGVAEEMVQKGRKVFGFCAYSPRSQLFRMRIRHQDTRYPFVLILAQSETEKVLIQRLISLGGNVEWHTELKELHLQADGIHGETQSPEKEETIRADWVVGCDGAHSFVRKALDLDFEGERYEESFYLADVRMDWKFSPEEPHLFMSPEGILVAFPFTEDNVFRLIVNDHSSEAPPAGTEPTIEDFQRWVDRRVQIPGKEGGKVADATWLAHFRIHRRQASSLRKGRAFIAGDAAHIHSPAGGQGMNISIQDAVNLGWKLALVIKGKADASLLDSYVQERRPVAKTVLTQTDQLTRMVTLRNPLLQWLRNWGLWIAMKLPVVNRTATRQLSELDIHYRESALVVEDHFGKGIQPGQRVGNLATKDPRVQSLHDLLVGPEFVLLYFSKNSENSNQLNSRSKEILDFLPEVRDHLKFYFVVPELEESGMGEQMILGDENLYQHFGIQGPSLYLLRPDGYVAYRCLYEQKGSLKDYLLGRIFTSKNAT